jgi:hypothetical protein
MVSVSLPAASGAPGSEVTVPVTVGDTTGLNIVSFDLQVTFDPAVVQPAPTPFDAAGTLSSAMLVTPNTDNAGHFIISAFQGAALAGSGTLINLKFTVVGTSGQSTPLTFTDYTDPGMTIHPGFQFNDGKPGNSTTNGSILVQSASISGRVSYANAAVPPVYISNATVNGAGSPNVSNATAPPGGTVGQYSLSGFGGGSYTVSVSKTTGQNGITSNDAARIAQFVAGITTFNNIQKVVSDVSNNNVVSSFDAAEIANYVVGGSQPGITGTWRFFLPPGPSFPVGASPTSRTYSPVTGNITGDDFMGLLIGEVSGNWSNTGSRPARGSQVAVGRGPERAVALTISDLATRAGNEILVPITVKGAAGKGIISYEFDLRFDPTVIQPQVNSADVAGTASRGLSAVTNAKEPGLLRVAVYGAMPLNGDGVLMYLRFTAVGAIGSVSPILWERIMFNEGEPQAAAAEGRVEVSY